MTGAVELGELFLSVLGAAPGGGGVRVGGRLAHHSHCVVASELLRGKLCQELARRTARQVEPGEFLYHMGEPARSVYLVRRGLIKTAMVSPGGPGADAQDPQGGGHPGRALYVRG